ncbi:hypothetical protein EON65_15965 [archaeon]|nr:MAG: hypothetical protein EON65_15965 [archaeon]
METSTITDDKPVAPLKLMTYQEERELQQNLIDDVKLAEKLFTEDRVGEAFFLLRNIDEFLAQLPPEAQENVVDAMRKVSNKLASIRSKGEELLAVLDQLTNKGEFNAWNSSIGPHQDVSLYTHADEKRGQCHIKLEGNIHCSLLHAVAAVLENELYGIWTPMCKAASCLSKVSLCRRVIALDLEFVLMQRKAICDVRLDVLPDGAVLISFCPLARLPDNDPFFPNSPTADLWGGILFKEIDIEVEELIAASAHGTPRNHRGHNRNNNSSNSSANVSLADIYAEDNIPPMVPVNSLAEADGDGMGVSGRARHANRRGSALPLRNNSGYSNTNNSKKQDHPHSPILNNLSSSNVDVRLKALDGEAGGMKQVKYTKKVVQCNVVFKADLHLDFIPDWM